MIDTLIFDFGDVFINLDKQGAQENALNLFKINAFEQDMIQANIDYEVGAISTLEFVSFYQSKFPKLSQKQVVDAWNFILKDFPEYRLKFIKKLAKENNYKLILLSNTNALHIEFIKTHVPFFEEFKACFSKFYLSHEVKLRKPNVDIFNYVIDENNLKPENCLFIDDTKENTEAALQMDFNIWNIDETKEDVVDLFTTKKTLF